MNEPEFNISLGGGLYMDSNGHVHRGAFPAAPTYPMPGGGALPITKEAFEKAITGTTKALQGIAKALPDPNDPDSVQKFTALGLPLNLVNLLGNLGGVAAKFAKVIPIIGAVVVVLEEFVKFFSASGPSPMELMIKAQFAHVHTHINALEMQVKLNYIGDKRDVISNAMSQINEYMETVTKFQPSLAELQGTRDNMRQVKENVAIAVEGLLRYETWLLSYNPGTFQQVSAWIGGLPHVAPAGTPAPPPVPAPPLPAHENRFEHGMMVPAVIHAVQSYLMLIKMIAPEYRSTGAYDEELRKFTVYLENLTRAMRAETLARTIYPVGPDHLGRFVDPSPWRPEEVIDLPGLAPVLSPSYARFPVGALDLCAHTDAFFVQKRQEGIAAGADPWLGPAVMGTMNTRWLPPAKLDRIEAVVFGRPETQYRITNPQECAAAANAQSEIDYANLLLSSGYLNLVQMTTLIRHLATEPDRSETVKGDVILLRNPQKAADVTVMSDDIVFTGVVQSTARREPASCRATIPISTQPLREDRMLPYRIVLRTLRSITSPGHWVGPEYGEYYSAYYEKDPGTGRAGFLRLVTETKDPWVLTEHELASGTSPKELLQRSGEGEEELKFIAHTFDWYVPVEPSVLDDDHLGDTLAALRSMGWSDAKPPPIPHKTLKGNPLKNPMQKSTLTLADEVAIVGSHTWRDGSQDWEGQRREIKQATVHIKYNLQWKADRLRITLENRPQDRNYVVFLVVEETFPATGRVLHTAIPVPMNGQLTYVPRKFFDDERAAIDKANRIILDVATRYAESGPVGPEDPFVGHINPGDLYSAVGLRRLASLAEQHQPALLRRAVQGYPTPTEPREREALSLT